MMPVYAYDSQPRDPRRWAKCLEATAAQMVADGWSKHAGKFTEVKLRRARRMYAQGSR